MKLQLVALILSVAICAVYAQPSHLKASSATSFSTKSNIDHKIDGEAPKIKFGSRNYLERRTKAAPKPVVAAAVETDDQEEAAPASDYIHESSDEIAESGEQEILKKGDKNHNTSIVKNKLQKKKNKNYHEALNKEDENVQQTADKYSKKKSTFNYVKDYNVVKSKVDLKHKSKSHDHSSFKDHSRNLFANSQSKLRRKGNGISESIMSSISQAKEDALNEEEGR